MTDDWPDHLQLLIEIARRAGHEGAGAAAAPRRQLGTQDWRRTAELDPAGRAAAAVLARLLDGIGWRVPDGQPTTYEVAVHVMTAARVASHLLPEVMPDWQGRFGLGLDDDGRAPVPDVPVVVWWRYAERLRGHLDEIGRSEWVDPHMLAGDVANVHDLALMVVLWHELFGAAAAAGPRA